MLTFYHAPRSRSSRIMWLLEELGQPYEVKPVLIKRMDGSGGADEAYRAINPHLKVPTVVHDGQTVIESAAICLYLADAFPSAGLAPKIGDPDRAAFITWLVYAAADFETSISGKAQKWAHLAYAIAEPDEVIAHVERALSAHPYIVGERFTAADVMIASILQFGIQQLKVVPTSPTFEAYLKRCQARPAFQRALAKDG